MTYYEQLKKAVTEAFNDATDKETIDKMASIQAAMDGLEQEQSELVKKNHELLVAYKEAIAHPGVSKQPEPDTTTVNEVQMPDFADILANSLKA